MSAVRDSLASEPASAALPGNQVVPHAHAAPVPLDDCSPAEQAERRYLAVINPLFSEAWDGGSLESFVEVLTWTLARVIVGMDKPQITGDVLRRIGNHTYAIAEAKRAAVEAEEARKEGRVPH
jgi:hypothetical protein